MNVSDGQRDEIEGFHRITSLAERTRGEFRINNHEWPNRRAFLQLLCHWLLPRTQSQATPLLTPPLRLPNQSLLPQWDEEELLFLTYWSSFLRLRLKSSCSALPSFPCSLVQHTSILSGLVATENSVLDVCSAHPRFSQVPLTFLQEFLEDSSSPPSSPTTQRTRVQRGKSLKKLFSRARTTKEKVSSGWMSVSSHSVRKTSMMIWTAWQSPSRAVILHFRNLPHFRPLLCLLLRPRPVSHQPLLLPLVVREESQKWFSVTFLSVKPPFPHMSEKIVSPRASRESTEITRGVPTPLHQVWVHVKLPSSSSNYHSGKKRFLSVSESGLDFYADAKVYFLLLISMRLSR